MRTKQLPVRIDEETIERLDKIVEKIGMGATRTAVIKKCFEIALPILEEKNEIQRRN